MGGKKQSDMDTEPQRAKKELNYTFYPVAIHLVSKNRSIWIIAQHDGAMDNKLFSNWLKQHIYI